MGDDPGPDVEVVVTQESNGRWKGRLRLEDGRVIYGTEEYLTGEIARAAMLDLARSLRAPTDAIDRQVAEALRELERVSKQAPRDPG